MEIEICKNIKGNYFAKVENILSIPCNMRVSNCIVEHGYLGKNPYNIMVFLTNNWEVFKTPEEIVKILAKMKFDFTLAYKDYIEGERLNKLLMAEKNRKTVADLPINAVYENIGNHKPYVYIKLTNFESLNRDTGQTFNHQENDRVKQIGNMVFNEI